MSTLIIGAVLDYGTSVAFTLSEGEDLGSGLRTLTGHLLFCHWQKVQEMFGLVKSSPSFNTNQLKEKTLGNLPLAASDGYGYIHV